MVGTVPIAWVLTLAAALFCVGLFGALSRRNTISMLMSIELMLNSVNINLVAFWRYLRPTGTAGLTFTVFTIAVAAAEVAVGLAMVIAVYRAHQSINADEIDTLKG